MSEPMTPVRSMPTDTSALVARSRRLNLGKENPETIFGQAATSIVALETRVKQLEKALREAQHDPNLHVDIPAKTIRRYKMVPIDDANAHGEAGK